MSRAPVAVTGLGAVSGYGWGVEALWRGPASPARPRSATSTASTTPRYRTHVAAEVPERRWRSRLAHAARPTLADRFALAAAAEALAAGGAARAARRASRAGLFFGGSTGGMFESESFFAGSRGGAPARAARLLARAAAERPRARRWRAPTASADRSRPSPRPAPRRRSPSAPRSTRCAPARSTSRSPAAADSLCRLTFAGFNSLRAVDPRPCRPFRAEREGMSIGEGAAVLVLETRAHAARAGRAGRSPGSPAPAPPATPTT